MEVKEQHTHSACACGSGGCGCHDEELTQTLDGVEVPGSFQLLQEGDRVLDLGSGTGIDSINMAKIIGPQGKIIGIDHSDKNIQTAREYLDKSNVSNVEFRLGEIDNIPVPNDFADVIYASCVFNLQENRQKVADEMYRVCDHNGYVCVSDYVIINEIPDALRKEAAELMGCIAGAEDVQTFMSYFQKTGFTKWGIVEVNKVKLPEDILAKHLSQEMITAYNDLDSDEGIFKVVLVVEKPETCSSDTCCCNPDKHKN